MTENKWLKCRDLDEMLRYLSSKASDRKLRLFACACCRRIWSRITAQRSRRAVEISEQYADKEADSAELESAFSEAGQDAFSFFSPEPSSRWDAHEAAWLAAHPVTRGLADGTAAAVAMEEARGESEFWEALARKKSQLCIILRDLFGNPFHTPMVPALILSWNDGIVPRLAEAAYDDRILPAGTLDNTRLLILADALEEAGCTDEQILTHLRGGGEHYRGCWVIDLLLSKQ